MIAAIDNIKHQQQHHRTDQYGHQHVFHRPHEIHALQETQKQRRIAQRRQTAADVCHQKDKKYNDMHFFLAVMVCLQQRANHQHRRTGRSHKGSHHRTRRQHPGIQRRRTVQLTPNQNPARNRVQSQKQQDKRNIFLNQRMSDRMHTRAKTEHSGKRN